MNTLRHYLVLSAVALLGAAVAGCVVHTGGPNDGGPASPQDRNGGGDSSVTASVQGEPRSAGRGREEVVVNAEGPSVQAVRDAAAKAAAEEVMGSRFAPGAFDDPDWLDQVSAHTEITRNASPRRVGGRQQLVEAVVRVNYTQLERWGNDAGYMRDLTSPTGFGSGAPEPTVAIMPFAQRGEWPEELSRDEQTVATLIARILGRDPYNVSTQDYEMIVRAGGAQARQAGVDQTNPEFLIEADIYIGFDVHVDQVRNGIRATISIRGVLVTTQDTVFENQAYSEVVSSDQRDFAIEQAAGTLAQDAIREIASSYNDEYSRGIPYLIGVRNVHTDAAMMELRRIAREFSTDGGVHRWEQSDGVLSFMIRADPQQWNDPVDVAFELRSRLAEAGYPHREGSQSAGGRFIAFELQSN